MILRLLLSTSLLALASVVSSGPIPPMPVDSPETPQLESYLNPQALVTPPYNAPEVTPDPQLSASLYAFTPSNQYSNQELRRQRRILANQAKEPFEHSPYGSGALPVPDGSRETGFGGRTSF